MSDIEKSLKKNFYAPKHYSISYSQIFYINLKNDEQKIHSMSVKISEFTNKEQKTLFEIY